MFGLQNSLRNLFFYLVALNLTIQVGERFFDLQRFAVIENSEDGVLVSGKKGNNYIYNDGSNVTITGGAGNDTVENKYYPDLVSIDCGAGNDTIKSDGSNVLLKYKSGDGKDRVEGLSMTDTLQIGGGTGTYSSTRSGNDLILTVGSGKITLVGMANESIYIAGKKSGGAGGSIKTVNNKTKSIVLVGKSLTPFQFLFRIIIDNRRAKCNCRKNSSVGFFYSMLYNEEKFREERINNEE